MSACCSTFECAADQQFNEKKAAAELKRYRNKGPGPTTRLLQETLAAAGMLSGTLLDIGAGIGSLTFGLLERGVARAVAVDASSAYTTVAHQEVERLGRADVVRFVHADFVSVASELPAATLVTLDRVVCCYPSYESLLNAALSHAERVLALSYPRDVWYVRLGFGGRVHTTDLPPSVRRPVVKPTLMGWQSSWSVCEPFRTSNLRALVDEIWASPNPMLRQLDASQARC